MVHEKIFITLDSGIEVEVLAFSFGYTYGGLLGGIPSDSINQGIYDRISYPTNWGVRKQLKLEPQYSEFIPGYTGLKHAYYSVWLYSNFAFDDKNDGTQLVVTWLDDTPNNKLIPKIIHHGIKDINWMNEATDFNY